MPSPKHSNPGTQSWEVREVGAWTLPPSTREGDQPASLPERERLQQGSCTKGSLSPASPPHTLHAPPRGCSPPGSGLLPADPGAGQRCLAPPCTPQAPPRPAPASSGTQNSCHSLCSADRSEAAPGSRDLEGEGGSRKGGVGGRGPSTSHLAPSRPCPSDRLLPCPVLGSGTEHHVGGGWNTTSS